MLVMLGSGLLLKIDEDKAHLPRSAFSFCRVDVYSPCEVCVGPVLGTVLCLGDAHRLAGRAVVRRRSGFFHLLFNADEAVCGAAMAGVVSAVFHLTHLVQWNK